MYSRLHVHNLDPATDQLALERLFAEHGEVLVTALRVDGDQSIGMVEMRLRADARAATVALHGSEHHDRVLSVSPSTAAQETAAGQPRMFTAMNAGDSPSAEAPEHPMGTLGSQQGVDLLRGQLQAGAYLLAGERLSSEAYDSWLVLARKSLQAACGATSPRVASIMECGRARWTEAGGGESQWERERAGHLSTQLTQMSGLIQLLDRDARGGL